MYYYLIPHVGGVTTKSTPKKHIQNINTNERLANIKHKIAFICCLLSAEFIYEKQLSKIAVSCTSTAKIK